MGKSSIKLPIKEVLDKIHTEFPSYNFPKYEAQLVDHGICYLIAASMFDPMFYAKKVGMNEGESVLFSAWVQKEVKKADESEQVEGKGKKRARVEDENLNA